MHVYSPPSSTFKDDMLTCAMTSSCAVTYWPTIILFDSGIGNPSKVQVNCGRGFPDATHFNDKEGPGCKVCSVNQYTSSGPISIV